MKLHFINNAVVGLRQRRFSFTQRGVAAKAFENRQEAGRTLARLLLHYRNVSDLLVLAISCGGVIVAYEIAQALNAELDILVVGNLPLPHQQPGLRLELAKRESIFQNNEPAARISGRTVILIDDGLASGTNMRLAISTVRLWYPGKIVVAVPVASFRVAQKLSAMVDDFICPCAPRDFHSLGWWYLDFRQTDDSELIALLIAARKRWSTCSQA